MNKSKYIARIITAICLFVMAISLLVALIYTFVDYQFNNFLNTFLGDFTSVLIIMLIFVSLISSLAMFFTNFKKLKKA